MLDFYKILDKSRVLKIYENILEESIDKNNLPKHIAIIMDGNRRTAEIYGKDKYYGHYLGAEKVREVLRWSRDLGIKVVTLYAFSTENFKRSEEEVNKLMELFEKKFYEIADDEETHKYEVRVRAIGRINLLPKNVQKAIKYAEKKTENYNKFFVNIAIAYGGQQEIIDAIKKIAEKVKRGEIEPEDINKKLIDEHLYTANLPFPNPDLIIRTSGEERISNFLIWQSSYSELYFCDTYWPLFRKIDFLRAVRDYQRRQRRFGK
ncbi:undecaprenyl diphosphate synthase [Methanocaldococcus vulcanius M7]|uniref:Tritrans,polycis-undecaprenyl-diphosphate synthase (geranylgeranyl-diphosphate specific) n=1 Tax=Methanocaldococcus vulcanius (strain ATCC 700851 / DSM 12094 / M7) TaxID=579137 RepID=C9RG86_METVM|nr:polyprenyl diphosphate synthase [Methanocaldococcus vulcanius]ACX72588.1 undecaprenyl diphosphate synthase [Methanocaldococcus vulcanius M7]